MTIAEFIARHGMTQEQFSKLVGVKQATIARYMRGDRFPRPEHMEVILKATDGLVTPNDHFRTYLEAKAKKGG